MFQFQIQLRKGTVSAAHIVATEKSQTLCVRDTCNVLIYLNHEDPTVEGDCLAHPGHCQGVVHRVLLKGGLNPGIIGKEMKKVQWS